MKKKKSNLDFIQKTSAELSQEEMEEILKQGADFFMSQNVPEEEAKMLAHQVFTDINTLRRMVLTLPLFVQIIDVVETIGATSVLDDNHHLRLTPGGGTELEIKTMEELTWWVYTIGYLHGKITAKELDLPDKANAEAVRNIVDEVTDLASSIQRACHILAGMDDEANTVKIAQNRSQPAKSSNKNNVILLEPDYKNTAVDDF